MNEQQLLDLKKKIESSKRKLSELKGKKKGLLETLKTKYDCNNFEEAAQKLEELDRAIKKLEDTKEKGIKDLEDNYEL